MNEAVCRVSRPVGPEIMVTRVGLRLPQAVSFGKWELAGLKIARIQDSSAWCLGDWLVFGQSQYKDRYRQAIDAAGLDYKTLRNYAWVARRFEIHRRREGLTFQHHAEVAGLPQDDQDRWLDEAERLAWSRNRLRESVRQSRQGGQPVPESSPIPRMSVATETIARWHEAAEATERSLDHWIVETLNAGAARILSDDPASGIGGHQEQA